MSRPPERLLSDAPPLLDSALADRIDVLGSPVSGSKCLTTTAVVHEIDDKVPEAAELVRSADWLHVVSTGESLEYLARFAAWSSYMGVDGRRHLGETTECAYADLHGGTVVLDDRNARKVAVRRGLRVCGTIRLLADACNEGQIAVVGASALVEALREAHRVVADLDIPEDKRPKQMYLPFPPGGSPLGVAGRGFSADGRGRPRGAGFPSAAGPPLPHPATREGTGGVEGARLLAFGSGRAGGRRRRARRTVDTEQAPTAHAEKRTCPPHRPLPGGRFAGVPWWTAYDRT